ncbi:type VI secretion system-associated protein TagF [Povalibacter sp.]|uniref:type VI secretion system-associated protein TagF n=1 Tax=Povalibacter sp. TaxID=1962978 RepID=UPI002F419813
MSGSRIGWFGKLPSHGDFLQRRAPQAFVNAWDPWLQECIAQSREQLGHGWLDVYLTSPVWRFFLSGGVVSASSYAGILLPSVDRVGRYFPLTIFAELPADLPPMAVAIHGREWLKTIEGLALHALQSEDFDVEQFDEAVQASSESLSNVEQYYGVNLGDGFPNASTHWRVPMIAVDRVAAALIDPLMELAGRHLQPLTLWWTEGSEDVGASCLVVKALPEPQRFSSMLDGNWAAGGWAGDDGDLVLQPKAQFNYAIASGGVTDTGPVRKMNQDRFLARAEDGLWAVADGMGGHSRGEYASQLAVDSLASIEPAATVSAALQSARTALGRANDDLVRSALSTSASDRSGSTVVVLCIRQQEWGVLWAGDSRVYLLRDGALRGLTRDHAVGVNVHDFDELNPGLSGGELTRALGGHETLLLDHRTGHIHPGDRFLLCSDGLHGVVDHQRLTQVLSSNSDPDAVVKALLDAAIAAGSRDNITAVVIDVIAA